MASDSLLASDILTGLLSVHPTLTFLSRCWSVSLELPLGPCYGAEKLPFTDSGAESCFLPSGVFSYNHCQGGDRKLPLSARPLLATDLHGRITEASAQQGGKFCSPSSATLRPKLLWADGWGFYSTGGCRPPALQPALPLLQATWVIPGAGM